MMLKDELTVIGEVIQSHGIENDFSHQPSEDFLRGSFATCVHGCLSSLVPYLIYRVENPDLCNGFCLIYRAAGALDEPEEIYTKNKSGGTLVA
jgi:hypothetical protein